MEINIEMKVYHPEVLVPRNGKYLIRTVEPEDLSIHYFQTFVSKEFNKITRKWALVFDLKREKVITHISKNPLT